MGYIFAEGLFITGVVAVFQHGCDKGQTTFEYLLLVGGTVLLAVLAVSGLTLGIQESARDVDETVTGIVGRFVKVTEKYLNLIDRTTG